MFFLQGSNDGFAWEVKGVQANDERFFARVQVGSTIKITPNTYKTEAEAKDAGISLMSNTLAELLDEKETIQ